MASEAIVRISDTEREYFRQLSEEIAIPACRRQALSEKSSPINSYSALAMDGVTIILYTEAVLLAENQQAHERYWRYNTSRTLSNPAALCKDRLLPDSG